MRKLLPVLLVALVTTGCGVIYRQPIYQGNLLESSAVEQLQAGMNKQQVLALLGTPSIMDPYQTDRWDYTSSQRIGRRARTETKNFTLWFEGDTLARWDGDYFAEQDEEIANNSVRQFGRNLAKEKDKKPGR
ncbi:outer membrane protein assembly factor BamE [Marilutibacter aestuarii]|uniref:Outer membrane protein assembly factor BamE n=1 Tax=Marilutibacter aestuarii TaxID=1706195 RepID=A0A508A1I7_9GAMM|nr:outer membrane protein assembly factor BamE [Lysobacter aestuarii]TQD42583.1 outer membrane protein assembly factor BamE [Lysobacter aestuarii]